VRFEGRGFVGTCAGLSDVLGGWPLRSPHCFERDVLGGGVEHPLSIMFHDRQVEVVPRTCAPPVGLVDRWVASLVTLPVTLHSTVWRRLPLAPCRW